MNIIACGKYLGFYIGPEAGKHSWLTPMSKYKQRAREIHVAALPAAFSASEYNTKCLPTLLHVSQLCPPPPHFLQAELGAIHKILHIPPQTLSYNLALNFSPLLGFNIRSAHIAMRSSMIRLALKSCPNAVEDSKHLIQSHLDTVPVRFSCTPGFPPTPGWGSNAYVSNLAQAWLGKTSDMSCNQEVEDFLGKIHRMLHRNIFIKESHSKTNMTI